MNRIARAVATTVVAGAAVLGAAGGATAQNQDHGQGQGHGQSREHGHRHGTEGGGVCASALVPLGLGNGGLGNVCT
ncbi:chaplin [Streptomyces sp. NPDC059373]